MDQLIGAEPALRNHCGALKKRLDDAHTFVHQDKPALVQGLGAILGKPAPSKAWLYPDNGIHEEANRDDDDQNFVRTIVENIEFLNQLQLGAMSVARQVPPKRPWQRLPPLKQRRKQSRGHQGQVSFSPGNVALQTLATGSGAMLCGLGWLADPHIAKATALRQRDGRLDPGSHKRDSRISLYVVPLKFKVCG